MNSRKIYRVCISDPADADNSNLIYEGWILSRTKDEAINLVMKDDCIDNAEFKDRIRFDIEKEISILDETPLLDNKFTIVNLMSKMGGGEGELASISKCFLEVESGVLAHRTKPIFPFLQNIFSTVREASALISESFDNLTGRYLFEFLVGEQKENYSGWRSVERSYYIIANNEYSIYETFANFRFHGGFDCRFYILGKCIHLLGISSLPAGIVGAKKTNDIF
ncbi:hypothetical protein EU528_03275 [Candidatus Thorarchaeota archaeon]|nr:MAG: hypothetical protein EU528_03275 [Candidatus Thorarchaeota archaeon]